MFKILRIFTSVASRFPYWPSSYIKATPKGKPTVLPKLQIYKKRHNNLKCRTKIKLQILKSLAEVTQIKYETVHNKTLSVQIDIQHLQQALKNIISGCLQPAKYKTKTRC